MTKAKRNEKIINFLIKTIPNTNFFYYIYIMNMDNSAPVQNKVTNMKNIVNSTSTTTKTVAEWQAIEHRAAEVTVKENATFTEDEKKKIIARIVAKTEKLLNGDASTKISRNDVGLLCGGISNSAVQAKFGKETELTLKLVKSYILEDHVHQKMDTTEKLTHQIGKLSNDEKAKLIAILTKPESK